MEDLATRLVTADAVEWLKGLPDGFADLCMPDLPYGIDHFRQGHKSEGAAGLSEYDDSEGVSLELFDKMVPEMVRVTKQSGWIVCFMSESNYGYLKDLFERTCLIHYSRRILDNEQCQHKLQDNVDTPCAYGTIEEPRWYWFRPNSQNNPRHPDLHAKNVIECILVFNRGSAKLLRPCDNVLNYDAEYGNRIHAMQKPLEMLKDMVGRFTLPGETVIDPVFGSGSGLAAAAAMARSPYGSDSNPALREPALGYVSAFFQGVAPKAVATTTGEFIDARQDDDEEEEFPAFDPDDDDFEELNFDEEA